MIKNSRTYDGIIPSIKEQGDLGKFSYFLCANLIFTDYKLPVYECLKEIAVDIAREVGFELCIRAYFEGDWSPFAAKIVTVPKFQTEKFWKAFSVISHTASVFREQNTPVSQLIECGIPLLMPDEVHRLYKDREWRDSVLFFYPQPVGHNKIMFL